MKILISLICILFHYNSNSLELIRDPIFENYFKELQLEYEFPEHSVYLIRSNKINAFVIDDSIYFTTEILKNISNESVLKSIYFHEVGHVYHKHYNSKKIENSINKNKKIFNNIFSIGAAIFTNNPNIGITANISLDQKLLNKYSNNSLRYEIQADNYMMKIIEQENINTSDLIIFFDKLPNSESFFKTHPTHSERINLFRKFINNKININSILFEWIKAKYFQNSKIAEFNIFFTNLNKGIRNKENLQLIDSYFSDYEVYKSGISIDKINEIYLNLIEKNSNSYLMIEYFNYIIDNNLKNNYQLIEKNKNNSHIQNEYFYYFLYGKYYNEINNFELSNFYFCQFYSLINLKDKSDYFCKKYDINNIPLIDKSYALFK